MYGLWSGYPLSGRVRDFHPLERAHGAQTKNRGYIANLCFCALKNYNS